MKNLIFNPNTLLIVVLSISNLTIAMERAIEEGLNNSQRLEGRFESNTTQIPGSILRTASDVSSGNQYSNINYEIALLVDLFLQNLCFDFQLSERPLFIIRLQDLIRNFKLPVNPSSDFIGLNGEKINKESLISFFKNASIIKFINNLKNEIEQISDINQLIRYHNIIINTQKIFDLIIIDLISDIQDPKKQKSKINLNELNMLRLNLKLISDIPEIINNRAMAILQDAQAQCCIPINKNYNFEQEIQKRQESLNYETQIEDNLNGNIPCNISSDNINQLIKASTKLKMIEPLKRCPLKNTPNKIKNVPGLSALEKRNQRLNQTSNTSTPIQNINYDSDGDVVM